MSTTVRAELSEKNGYRLERHRYYELRHFCLQYPTWKKLCAELDSLVKNGITNELVNKKPNVSSPVEDCVEQRKFYSDRIDMIENAAKSLSRACKVHIKGCYRGLFV